MSGEVDVSTASGILKKVYDTELGDPRPSSAILQTRIPFAKGKRIGDTYQIPVALRGPAGFTYVGSGGTVTALKAPRNMVIKQAAVTPFELDLREQIVWTALSRAAEEGPGAVKSLTSEVVLGMKMAARNRLEASILHGQRGYGTVDSVTQNGQDVAVVFTDDTFARGLWWAMGELSTWDFFTSTTKNNASGPAILKAGGINAAARTVTFTVSGTASAEIAAGDVVYPEGAWDGTTHAEMPGLLVQAANTTGTSLGLSGGTYSNWQGNYIDVSDAAPSYGVVEDLLSVVRDRGADGKLYAVCGNQFYSQVVVELAQLKIIVNDSKKGNQGFSSVSYESPDVGEVELVKHPFMKKAEFLVLPEGNLERVGSSDITMGIPGLGEMVQYVAAYNAGELGLFTDQCVINKRPSHGLLAYNFSY
jgi:hypothetical protein